MDLASIQAKIQEYRGYGWLFCDHHHRDEIAYDILDVDRRILAPATHTRNVFFYRARHLQG